MKKMSIKMAILIPALAVLVVGVCAMVVISGIRTADTANQLTREILEETGYNYANDFNAVFVESYGTMQSLLHTAKVLKGAPENREKYVNILSEMVGENKNIFGLWTCFEPNAFDGQDAQFAGAAPYHDQTGRFIPYVYSSGSSTASEPLRDYEESDYYLLARDSGEISLTEPYEYEIEGKSMLLYSIAFPLIDDGKVLGVVGADISLDAVNEKLSAAQILESGYLFVISPGGTISASKNSEELLKNYKDTWIGKFSQDIDKLLSEGGSLQVDTFSDIDNTNVVVDISATQAGNMKKYWAVCAVVTEDVITSSAMVMVTLTIIIGIVLLLVVGVTLYLIIGLRLKELPVMTKVANALALGDIESAKIEREPETKNEISQLKKAFSSMVDTIGGQVSAMRTIAGGDLSIDVHPRSDKDALNLSISEMLVANNRAFSDILASSGQVSSGARQIAEGAQSLAQGSTEQASAVEQLSASINEVDHKTRDNSKLAEKAATLSQTIRISAQKGSEQMNLMMKAVSEINEASQSINKVIKVIDDIAFQTNILALNAAVEAARAGQHGRGFAVVAEEVRNLAAKSSDAAKDTGTLIANSMEKAELGSRIAQDTFASLGDIVSGINESTAIITEISTSSEEQCLAISEINRGIEQVAQVVQQNSATAEESAAASEQMSAQSSVLNDLASQFKLKNSFIHPPEIHSNPKPRADTHSNTSMKQLAATEIYLPPENENFGKY